MSGLLANFSLSVGRGEQAFSLNAAFGLDLGVLVLFGPSGSGKSLTVKALAGLLRPQQGTIQLGDRILFDSDASTFVPAHRRRVGYVPQHQELFEFCNVEENVAFGLRRSERATSPWVAELMDALGIMHLAKKRPASLSGGERQCVAVARAIAVKPELLLLDEPFASLDDESRIEIHDVVRKALAAFETPAVLVTHSRMDAEALGDRLVRYHRGYTGNVEPLSQVSRRAS